MIFSVLALALCIGAAVITVRAVNRKKNKKWGRPVMALAAAALSLAYMAAAGLVYFELYYHADADAMDCLGGSENVKVGRTENGYLFDGPGNETAIIFYPGAKVEAEAYAPLMLSIAESGQDAFLVEMPLRFAFFGIDSAEILMEDHDYDSWYLMGHSLGGVAACEFAEDHPGEVDGLILLASYPAGGPYEDVDMLMIYGTQDGCLNADEYEKSKPLWPDDTEEVVIEGGNHAQFGSYGEQKGDGEAGISAEEQWSVTAETIGAWIEDEESE